MDTQSLYNTLYIFLDWPPARNKTFAELMWGVVKSRTVRIKDLAMHVSSKGNVHAKIIKVERLFIEQVIDSISMSKIIMKWIVQKERCKIVIDRTHWTFGVNNLNFFVAAIVYDNISIPIAWLLLDKKGSSSTTERQKRIERQLWTLYLLK